MLTIVLFGPPGAGKGTQSQKLIEKYDLVHISTGDILRAERNARTLLGQEAQKYIDKGQLVPDSVVIGMLSSRISQYQNPNGFIFDGFPRTTAQAKALDKLLAERGLSVDAMIALEVEEEELKKRILLRAKESGRVDDQDPEVIRKRIEVYNNETAPVKDYYIAHDKYHPVKGIGSINEIFDAICGLVDAAQGA